MEADQVYIRVEDEFRLERIETAGILTETKRMLMDPSPTQEPKHMELQFSKRISQPTLTCHEIEGEGSTFIEVVLMDSSTGKKIEVGPAAYASVELVVLAQGTDDCTGVGFSDKIVTVAGKKPLLTVNLYNLQRGSCVLQGVKFRHHATQVKPNVFRLGARIVGTFDGIMVKEAKTESFAIKCYRNKYSMKNEIPKLTDKIWVLENIQRRGKIYERLKAEGIDTVEEFLIQLLINPLELKNVINFYSPFLRLFTRRVARCIILSAYLQVARSKGKKWEGTIRHSRKCQSEKLCWYYNSQETSGVAFDIFGELQWMYSRGEYAATNMLSEINKVDADRLLSSAFQHWEDVDSFDDADSLQQHLEAIKTSHVPAQYPGMNPDIRAADQVVDGSNNVEAPEPLLNQGIPMSAMNPLARCEDFGIHDFRLIDGFYSPLDQCFGTMLTYFYNEREEYGPRIDGTGSLLAESKEVENAVLLMRKDLNRKKTTSEANSAGKKPKKC